MTTMTTDRRWAFLGLVLSSVLVSAMASPSTTTTTTTTTTPFTTTSTTVASETSSSSSSSLSLSRRLEDGQAAEFAYDLSSFSVRFEKCQYVKAYDDELAEDEDSDTVLAMKHLVVFKLCPSDECGTCDGVHGEYVLGVEDYLESTVEFQKEQFEDMCENCNEMCNNDGNYCSGCGKLCYQYDNLEANGMVDASEYLECQRLEIENDDDGNDDGQGDDDAEDNELYIGPRCNSDGSKIIIGLFKDEDCWEPYDEQDPEELLGMKLSYHLLANSYSNDGSVCLGCQETPKEDDQNDEDAQDKDQVNEMCENLYGAAAKCESRTGLSQGFVLENQKDDENENYENQVENEFFVCNFIESLILNSYTETGEINIEDEQDVVIRLVTKKQSISLGLLAVTIAGLALLGWHLDRKIASMQNNVDLAARGDGHLA